MDAALTATAQDLFDRMEAEKLVAWCFGHADDVLAVHDLDVDEPGRPKLAKAIAAQVQRISLALEREA
ncbi:hypothetical protein ACUN0C_01490 [Faunimonas sp. B44]|uniref:hypothetical protein n=1 Tax=Faunimonas sp. B44 TaxID=3461493 RepID=UPI004044ABCD